VWAPSIRARITGGSLVTLVYHITCTTLSAVAANGGSLAALGDSIISQLSLAVKVNSEYIGTNDVITADRDH